MSSGAVTVRVKGLKEFQRDMRRGSKELGRRMTRELAAVGKPIADDARSRADRYGSAVSNKIRPRVKGSSLFVESRARSKGKRPDFGATVFRTSLFPAAEQGTDEVVEGLERMMDALARDLGF